MGEDQSTWRNPYAGRGLRALLLGGDSATHCMLGHLEGDY